MLRRRTTKDTFRADNGFSWDYFMVHTLTSIEHLSLISIYLIKASHNNQQSHNHFRSQTLKVYDEDEELTGEQIHYSMTYILDRLTSGGLETRLFYSTTSQEVFCKIRCPLKRIQLFADFLNYRLELDHSKLKDTCLAGKDVSV